MPTMGALRCWPPIEPSEGVPKENTPPSEAVIRYPGPLSVDGVTGAEPGAPGFGAVGLVPGDPVVGAVGGAFPETPGAKSAPSAASVNGFWPLSTRLVP